MDGNDRGRCLLQRRSSNTGLINGSLDNIWSPVSFYRRATMNVRTCMYVSLFLIYLMLSGCGSPPERIVTVTPIVMPADYSRLAVEPTPTTHPVTSIVAPTPSGSDTATNPTPETREKSSLHLRALQAIFQVLS